MHAPCKLGGSVRKATQLLCNLEFVSMQRAGASSAADTPACNPADAQPPQQHATTPGASKVTGAAATCSRGCQVQVGTSNTPHLLAIQPTRSPGSAQDLERPQRVMALS